MKYATIFKPHSWCRLHNQKVKGKVKLGEIDLSIINKYYMICDTVSNI